MFKKKKKILDEEHVTKVEENSPSTIVNQLITTLKNIKLTARLQATSLWNMGTCSRAIWVQQASFPTRATTGSCQRHVTNH